MLHHSEALQVLLQAYVLSPIEASVGELCGEAWEKCACDCNALDSLCELPLRIILVPDRARGHAAGHLSLSLSFLPSRT